MSNTVQDSELEEAALRSAQATDAAAKAQAQAVQYYPLRLL